MGLIAVLLVLKKFYLPWLEYSGRSIYLHKSGKEFYYQTFLNWKLHSRYIDQQKESMEEEYVDNIDQF